jgi:hypothetical protein
MADSPKHSLPTQLIEAIGGIQEQTDEGQAFILWVGRLNLHGRRLCQEV